jgi:hypothetical protein
LCRELWTNWKDHTSSVLVPAFGDSNAVWCGYEVYRQDASNATSVQKWKSSAEFRTRPK